MNQKKIPHPVDEFVGMRLRWQRLRNKVSQERLGESLEVTFQQIQKYEKGANRISASRLWQISQILGVPISFFFEGYEGTMSGAAGFSEDFETAMPIEFLKSNEGIKLIETFNRITNPKKRKNALDILETLADE